MTHRQMNWMLAIVAAITLVAGTVMTPDDFASEAQKERREWMAAVSICHRMHGPNTGPEYNAAGLLVCVGRKGQELGPVLMVATK